MQMVYFPANYEETESRGWYAALLLAMIACYALTLTGIVLLYVYYTTVSITSPLLVCAIVRYLQKSFRVRVTVGF